MGRHVVCEFGRRPGESAVLAKLTDPERIQEYLDSLNYSADLFYRSARSVVRDRKANCFDGALLAAFAFQHLGQPPLLMDMWAARDNDHVIALYRRNGCWGAVAVSNVVGLRFREPIFRTGRELALSYFEEFYNLDAEKTLRSYSVPLDMRFFRFDWTTCDERLTEVATKLDQVRHYPLLTQKMVDGLAHVDRRLYRAGLLGANRAGMYHPPSAGASTTVHPQAALVAHRARR
jgi:hypothetical protein